MRLDKFLQRYPRIIKAPHRGQRGLLNRRPRHRINGKVAKPAADVQRGRRAGRSASAAGWGAYQHPEREGDRPQGRKARRTCIEVLEEDAQTKAARSAGEA